MNEMKGIGDIVAKAIMVEMRKILAMWHGTWPPIYLGAEPPPAAPLPKPRLRLLQGGKETSCGSSSAD